jgi:hypothetical protein
VAIPLPNRMFTAQTADGNSNAVNWAGGRGVFMAWGTFGGGTCKLQMSPDDGTTWINVDRTGDTFVTLTANGEGGFELPKCKLRANLAGSTGASVNAGVQSANQGV